MDGEGLFGDAGVEPDLEFGPQERAPEPDDRAPEPDLQFGAQDFLGGDRRRSGASVGARDRIR